MDKLTSLIKQFEKATNRLKEVLDLPKTDIIRDSAIQRFEFSLDLAWKSLKAYLSQKHGLTVASPKKTFKEAFHQGIIEYDEKWLDLVNLRNETVHTYNEKRAKEVFAQLPEALTYFQKLLPLLKK